MVFFSRQHQNVRASTVFERLIWNFQSRVEMTRNARRTTSHVNVKYY